MHFLERDILQDIRWVASLVNFHPAGTLHHLHVDFISTLAPLPHIHCGPIAGAQHVPMQEAR